MALPKINDVPKYSVKIPSTGKTITYRPFLVKEQKILLMAMESKDPKEILRAITDTIESCAITAVDLNKLATFDVEYIFTQIRSKSVGEISSVSITCSECNFLNGVDINLNDIKIDINAGASNKIKLTEEYTLELKYPTYSDVSNKAELMIEDNSMSDMLFTLVKTSLDKLLTNEDIIDFANESEEEIDNFLEGLTEDQFKQIVDFVQNVPALTHRVDFKCISCNKENSYKLQGINDFF